MTLTVFLAGPLPNLANRRLHWAARAALVRLWREKTFLRTTGAERAQHGGNGAPWERCRVTLTVRLLRRWDPDNLAANLKPVVDGLFGLQLGGRWTRRGVLAGHDGDGQHEIVYRQIVDRTRPGVELLIEENDERGGS